jgi:hypothetical protein
MACATDIFLKQLAGFLFLCHSVSKCSVAWQDTLQAKTKATVCSLQLWPVRILQVQTTQERADEATHGRGQ